MRRFLVGGLAGLLIAGCAGRPPHSAPPALQSFLPQNGEVQGFQREGEASFGQGLTGLAAIIDGGAEAYVKLSARAGVFQDYAVAHEARERVTVTIYQAEDAGRLYRGIYPGRSQSVPGIGEEARSRLDLFGATELDFHQGPYYVELVITSARPTALEQLRQFAEVISRRMRTSS